MLRVGTVPYLVARPLTEGLAERAGVTLTAAPPAELARLLAVGELDVALASSVLAVEDPRFRLWTEGPVIASDGPVRSVLLLLRPGLSGPGEVERVALDPHSRTGRALARIVLRERWACAPEAVEAPAGEAAFAPGGADAVQRIGDPALEAAAAQPDWGLVDLGEEWRLLTGLPFVFAGWIGRPGFDPAEAAPVLEEAAAAGLPRREELAAATRLRGVSADFLRRYLVRDLRYHLGGERTRAALAEFRRRLGGLAFREEKA